MSSRLDLFHKLGFIKNSWITGSHFVDNDLAATGTLIVQCNLLCDDSDKNPGTPLVHLNKYLIEQSREAIEDLLHFVVMQS